MGKELVPTVPHCPRPGKGIGTYCAPLSQTWERNWYLLCPIVLDLEKELVPILCPIVLDLGKELVPTVPHCPIPPSFLYNISILLNFSLSRICNQNLQLDFKAAFVVVSTDKIYRRSLSSDHSGYSLINRMIDKNPRLQDMTNVT